MFKMCVNCGFMYDDDGNGCPQCGEGKVSQNAAPSSFINQTTPTVKPAPSVPVNATENEVARETPAVSVAPAVSYNQPAYTSPTVPTQAKETSGTSVQSSGSNTKNKKIVPIIIVAVIALVAIAAIIGIVSLGNSPEPEPNYDNYDDAVIDTYEPESNAEDYEEENDDSYSVSDDVAYTQVDGVGIVSINATSVLGEKNATHYADNMLDGDLSTAWVEGSVGNGIGESLTIKFDKEYEIADISINAGYQKSSEHYVKNSRPKEIEISFSDGTSETHILDDVECAQSIQLLEPVSINELTITILSVYPGDEYEDTCISEIGFILSY